MSTPSATGVAAASSTVLSVTCPDASTLPFPGGSPGPIRKITIGVMITVAISHSTTMLRQWRVSSTFNASPARSYDLQVTVHVADRLHRAAEPTDVAGRARHEALPAVEALVGRAERKSGLGVVVREAARRVATRVLGGCGYPVERDRQADLWDREHV